MAVYLYKQKQKNTHKTILTYEKNSTNNAFKHRDTGNFLL